MSAAHWGLGLVLSVLLLGAGLWAFAGDADEGTTVARRAPKAPQAVQPRRPRAAPAEPGLLDRLASGAAQVHDVGTAGVRARP